MDNELKKACALYCEICDRTNYGEQKGMPIREIRKKYGLKKRDIVVLLQFLQEIADLDYCVDFVVYNPDGHPEGVELSVIEEAATNSDIYICIMDHRAYMPRERLDETDFNIQNETLFQKLSQNDVSDVLKEISNISEEDLKSFIINKGTERKNILEKKKKQKLVWAILNRNAVQITAFGEKKEKKKIYPLGLYYVKLQEIYKMVYSEQPGQTFKEVELPEIASVEILDEKHDMEFHIQNYIEQKKTEKIVLNVYDEGNVIKKMDLLLSEYKVQKLEKENYVEYDFMAENADMFENTIRSFGRSVIVKEPAYLRDKIYQSTKEILDFYKKEA